MSKGSDFDTLFTGMAALAEKYDPFAVITTCLCLSETAIHRHLLENQSSLMKFGNELTAMRLEFMAQLIRGEDPEEPFDLVLLSDNDEEEDNEKTH